MPFLGRDWRSPGEHWVKTNDGWENLRLWRVKLFENLNENVLTRLIKLALLDLRSRQDIQYVHQPHVHFIRGKPSERRIPMSLAEVFIRMDIAGAVRDIRRFNYVSKVLKILVGSKFSSLSGSAQKHVLNILEHMLSHCLTNNINVNTVRELVRIALNSINDNYSVQTGSDKLWVMHKHYVMKMHERLNNHSMSETETNGLELMDLPDDCLHKILSHMNDHRDILHTGMTNTSLYDISDEPLLWRQLSMYHFNKFQLMTFLPRETHDDNIDWKDLYRRCVRRYGQRADYADEIAACNRCDNLFWQSKGHPCVTHEIFSHSVLHPEEFVELLLH